LVSQVAPLVGLDQHALDCPCRSALQYALITAPTARDVVLAEKLAAVAGRVLKGKL
jgi:5'-methylthioadenosine phosphorylase